jgi:hypothetical protein
MIRRSLPVEIVNTPSQSAPVHLEVSLHFLIRRSEISVFIPRRRLNAIENMIARLARPWRAQLPIDPALELRLSQRTRHELFLWIGPCHETDTATTARLVPYTLYPVEDESVPNGWIRLLILGCESSADPADQSPP